MLSPIEGASGDWQADIVIGVGGHFDPEPTKVEGIETRSGTLPMPRVVLECKYAEPADSGSSFDTNLARAYVRLNDIHLKQSHLKLIVVVNREPRTGEQSRNYRKLFGNIGVQFLNFNDLEDRAQLKQEALRAVTAPTC